MKIKTLLTGNVAKTHTIKMNQHNLNDQLKSCSTVFNQKLGSAQSIQTHTHTHTQTNLSTTEDFNNSIYILPKRNFDEQAETEFRCFSLEANLLSAHENYTSKQVNWGTYQDGTKGQGKERSTKSR
jgi:hypothetical protein